jgi:hypothetical protein
MKGKLKRPDGTTVSAPACLGVAAKIKRDSPRATPDGLARYTSISLPPGSGTGRTFSMRLVAASAPFGRGALG